MSELKVEIAKLINEVEFLIKKKTSGKIKENEKEKIEEYLEKLQHEINIKKKEQDELKHKKVDRMIKNEYEKIYVYNSSNKGKNVEEIKKQRDEEIKRYQEAVEYKEKYDRIDSKEYPSYMFLYYKIEKHYGKYTDLYVQDIDKDMEGMIKRKVEFLNKKDGGEYFRKILEYINNTTYKDIDSEIDELIKELIGNEEEDELKTLITEYNKSKIKTKIVKKKYNKICEKLEEIHLSKNIDIYKYYNTRYNMNIPIPNKYKWSENLINRKIEEYERNKKEIEQEKKYKRNLVINLNRDMLNYIRLNKNIKILDVKKKWEELTEDMQNEKIKEYINKIGAELDENEIENLKKRMKKKDIKWNVKEMKIDEIKIIRYCEKEKKYIIENEKTTKEIKRLNEDEIEKINEIILKCIIEDVKTEKEEIVEKCIKVIKNKKKLIKDYVKINLEKIKELVK
jgi:hypothetical protein